MVRWIAALIPAMLVAGCQSAGKKAEDRYEFLVQSHASADDLCAAAQDVKSAYADDRNSSEFTSWSATAATDCLRASMRRR